MRSCAQEDESKSGGGEGDEDLRQKLLSKTFRDLWKGVKLESFWLLSSLSLLQVSTLDPPAGVLLEAFKYIKTFKKNILNHRALYLLVGFTPRLPPAVPQVPGGAPGAGLRRADGLHRSTQEADLHLLERREAQGARSSEAERSEELGVWGLGCVFLGGGFGLGLGLVCLFYGESQKVAVFLLVVYVGLIRSN